MAVAAVLLAAAAVVLPPPGGRADYQLGGAYPPGAGVAIVTRDRTEPPAGGGTYGVCYVNAFQAETAARRWWERRHPRLLLRDARGRLVIDRDWDEPLLDLRRGPALTRVVGRWIDGCKTDGYDAVELDNLDSWTRSRGTLRRRDAVAYARRLTARAHRAGLAVAQKNAAELAPRGRSIGFDFAVAEECQRFHECDAYTRVYGDRLIEIEYPDAGGRANFRAACRARGDRVSVLYRDRDVTPRGSTGYLARWCP